MKGTNVNYIPFKKQAMYVSGFKLKCHKIINGWMDDLMIQLRDEEYDTAITMHGKVKIE